MIYECDKCKGEMLTEADPYLIVPKPDGTEIVCHKCFENKLVQQKALLDLAGELLVEVDDLFGQHMDERWHDKLNQILGKEEGKQDWKN